MRREENTFFNGVKYIIFVVFFAVFCSLFFSSSHAFANSLRVKYEYQHLVVKDTDIFFEEESESDIEQEKNKKIEFCFSDENDENTNQERVDKRDEDILNEKKINTQKIKDYVEASVIPLINQEKHDVVISRNTESNEIVFDGYAQEGVAVNIDATVRLIEFALENNIDFVNIAVEKTPPMVMVNDEELKKLGITELVAVGRSDFSGSSWKRIINVTNGASKFNGYLIPKDSTFSFNTQLGEINASTGFVRELVILGNKVAPEYGGGLCQVSSTAYRGAMLSGMEIVERHNHSYAVGYYAPHGSDATIYAPLKDFKFKNTSGNALLLQTRRGGHDNNELFFHYYGTKPKNREVEIFGPFVSDYRGALPSKTTYDPSLPAGTSKVVSHSVAGFNSAFYRNVEEKGEQLYEDIFVSKYQARGYWLIKGGEDPASVVKKEPAEVQEVL